jgi:hypothetical protein
MDQSIDNDSLEHAQPVGPKRTHRSDHLMCTTPLWGLAGFVGCAYFAWVSFMRVTRGDYEWPHDWWTAATYLVWIILLAGLGVETQCWRERLFFVALVINFFVGCGLTVWHGATPEDVRIARIGTGALWGLAAVLSLTTLSGVGTSRKE